MPQSIFFNRLIWTFFVVGNSALGTAVPEKLYAAFQNEVGNDIDITAFYGSWVSQAGYPVLFVTASKNRDSIEVTQQRFLRNYNQQQSSKVSTLWHIPITYATNEENSDFSSTKTNAFISKEKQTIKLGKSAEWIVFNVQQSGEHLFLEYFYGNSTE